MVAIVRQVAHVCIFAGDLEATEAFWSGVLGLPVAFRFTRNGAPYGFYLTAGGTTNICARVSHAEECFQSETNGRCGRFSRPSTV